jgi:uncharacterized protein (DUF433 family)
MNSATLEPLTVPLRRDGSGSLRVGKTRVLLELIIRAFRNGATPEEIVQAFDTLMLPDVYAVLAWYLNNEVVATEYMNFREQAAEHVRADLETLQPLRKNLLKSLIDKSNQSEARRAPTDQ